MTSLGVNIDHIANVRQARQTVEPDPVSLAFLAELGGADGITVHLREDRRHIQDRDIKLLRELIKSRLNLEMAATSEMVEIALEFSPDMVTLVPERREEVTTEGGLSVATNEIYLTSVINKIQDSGIPVSLFVDPLQEQLEASARTGAAWVELHTGKYAEASWQDQEKELSKIKESIARAKSLGLRVNAGHGLTYQNVENIAAIKGIEELNIGHTIIARSIAIGLKEAVREMKDLITNPRSEPLFKQPTPQSS
jgi:pyridoxine 5-phosphate synthase